MISMKSTYVCGPLTELSIEEQTSVKAFYVAIADLFEKTTSIRAFVPHEHYDPIKNANFTSAQVDEAERKQVCENSALLVVVAIAPSWGGGIEVEMANRSGVPVVILAERAKMEARKISRLLRGNPAVAEIISYDSQADALEQLKAWLEKNASAVVSAA